MDAGGQHRTRYSYHKIPTVNNPQKLGVVTLDNLLTFSAGARTICNTHHSRNNVLNSLTGIAWGKDDLNDLGRPIFNYAAVTHHGRSCKGLNRKQYERQISELHTGTQQIRSRTTSYLWRPSANYPQIREAFTKTDKGDIVAATLWLVSSTTFVQIQDKSMSAQPTLRRQSSRHTALIQLFSQPYTILGAEPLWTKPKKAVILIGLEKSEEDD